MDDDEDVPLNPAPTEKPKVPEGISAFNIASARSGADLFEEESAAIAGEDVTIIVQLPDKELEVKMKMGHTVELLKLKAREMLGDTSIKLELRLAESDQVLIDPLSLNDYPIDSKAVVKVKGAIL